jgi:hypothetical protein
VEGSPAVNMAENAWQPLRQGQQSLPCRIDHRLLVNCTGMVVVMGGVVAWVSPSGHDKQDSKEIHTG